MKLQLEAKGSSEERILAYLEENASEVLAENINNGVRIEKDGNILFNKKDMAGFMKYAQTQARKLVTGSSACVEDDIVYGWAIQYFSDDNIEGALYTEDGKLYTSRKTKGTTPLIKPSEKTVQEENPKLPEPKKKKQENQMSLFDLMTQEAEPLVEGEPFYEEIESPIKEKEENEYEIVEEETVSEKPTILSWYQNYLNIQSKYPETIVFYRLGDFYELFNEDAKVVATALDLTLTGRDVGLEERVPMTGVPYHKVEEYTDKLTELGYKVALVKDADNIQVKEPQLEYEIDDSLLDVLPMPLEKEVEEEKHWIDDTTYVDKDGVVHTVETEEEEMAKELENLRAFDKEALLILSDMFDGIFAMG